MHLQIFCQFRRVTTTLTALFQLTNKYLFSSSSRPEPQKPPKPHAADGTYYHSDEEEEEYRRQLAHQTKQGYYVNPQKYRDTEL